MIFHAFLIKYAEIAIKGKNRYLFEDALVKQMKLHVDAACDQDREYRKKRRCEDFRPLQEKTKEIPDRELVSYA